MNFIEWNVVRPVRLFILGAVLGGLVVFGFGFGAAPLIRRSIVPPVSAAPSVVLAAYWSKTWRFTYDREWPAGTKDCKQPPVTPPGDSVGCILMAGGLYDNYFRCGPWRVELHDVHEKAGLATVAA